MNQNIDRYKKIRQYFYGACLGVLGFILLLCSQILHVLNIIHIVFGLGALASAYYFVRMISEQLTHHFVVRMTLQEKGRLNYRARSS